MDVSQLQREYVNFGGSMYREGYLDEQFTLLQGLADEDHSRFVLDVISLFFNDADSVLNSMTTALEKPEIQFSQVLELVHTIKGSSCSVGAKKMNILCIAFKGYCKEESLQGCVTCLNRLKHEFAIVRSKLETLLSMQKQILEAGGEVPLIE